MRRPGRPTAPPAPERALRAPRAWLLLLITLVIGLGVDLVSKQWSFDTVATAPVAFDRDLIVASPQYDPVPPDAVRTVIPSVLQLRLVINRGAVFGIAANRRAFFIAFTGLALLGGLWVFGRMLTRRAWAGHIAVGCVLAGGLGNLHDRIFLGAVRDFLHLMPGHVLPFSWRWPGGSPDLMPWVFNVADVLLLSGMVVLIAAIHRRPHTPEEEAVMAIEGG